MLSGHQIVTEQRYGLIMKTHLLAAVALTSVFAAGCGSAGAVSTVHSTGPGAVSSTPSAPAGSATDAGLQRCRTSQLGVGMTSNGAAGSVRLTLTFTNKGSTP